MMTAAEIREKFDDLSMPRVGDVPHLRELYIIVDEIIGWMEEQEDVAIKLDQIVQERS